MSALPLTPELAASMYSSHHGWLHNWLWRKLGCKQGAADIAHDTFVRILSAAPDQPLREPRAYLSTIASGLLANHWRRLTLERAYLAALAELEPALAPSPEERALALEALCQVDAMLANLPAKVRQAFMMSQLDGMTYAAIGEQLQVSERMVKKYMAQATLQCLLLCDA